MADADSPEHELVVSNFVDNRRPLEAEDVDELDSDNRSQSEEEYPVEAILACKKIKGQVRYKIKWQGYDETSWEPIEVRSRTSWLASSLFSRPSVQGLVWPVYTH